MMDRSRTRPPASSSSSSPPPPAAPCSPRTPTGIGGEDLPAAPPAEADREDAKESFVDLTRNIQRNEGPRDGSAPIRRRRISRRPENNTVIKGVKTGRNDSMSLTRKRQEIQEVFAASEVDRRTPVGGGSVGADCWRGLGPGAIGAQPRTQEAGSEPAAQAQRAGSDSNLLQPRKQRAGSDPTAATSTEPSGPPSGASIPALRFSPWRSQTPASGLNTRRSGGESLIQSPIGPFGAHRVAVARRTSAFPGIFHPSSQLYPAQERMTSCTTPGMPPWPINNYVLLFEGWRPLARELAESKRIFLACAPAAGCPNLPGFLPEKNRVRNSERYVVGGSPSAASNRESPILGRVEDGAEAVLAVYNTSAGDLARHPHRLPTPQLARARQSAFESQQGWSVKRSGTLIAVFLNKLTLPAAPPSWGESSGT